MYWGVLAPASLRTTGTRRWMFGWAYVCRAHPNIHTEEGQIGMDAESADESGERDLS